MRISGYQCNQCGTVKQATNHWLLRPTDANGFRLVAWDERWAEEDDIEEHLCGEQCAGKSLSQWLARQQESARKAAGQ